MPYRRRLSSALALTALLAHSAHSTFNCTAPFNSQLVLNNMPFSAIMAVKLGCDMFVTNSAAGVYRFDLCAFNASGVPIDATDTSKVSTCPGTGFDSRHAIQVVSNPSTGAAELWVSNKSAGTVERINPGCGAVITSYPISGGVPDGLSYAAGVRGYKLAVAVRGFLSGAILELDLATGATPMLVSLGTEPDHIAWDPINPSRFLYIAGKNEALTADLQGPSVCSIESIHGVDGVAFAVGLGGGKIAQPEIWFNRNGQSTFFPTTNPDLIRYNRTPVPACARTATSPCGSPDLFERGDGVGAPADGWLYACSASEVNRIDPPTPDLPTFLMPGGSPEANFLVALLAFQEDGCFRSDGIANSLVDRMVRIQKLLTDGKPAVARQQLQSLVAELEQGPGGITCPNAAELLALHAKTLLALL